jgi:hypothetical protein
MRTSAGVKFLIKLKLQVLLPNESPAHTAAGRTGTPFRQLVNVPFNVTVNAVDQAWYPVNTVNDQITVTSTDPLGQPLSITLVSGTATFPFTFKSTGYHTLTATDVTDLGKTPNTSSQVQVESQ